MELSALFAGRAMNGSALPNNRVWISTEVGV